jgi:hypothetical protein
MTQRIVRINGKPVEILASHTETTFFDRGRGLGALRILTLDAASTRYEGAFLLDPTAGDYGHRDREQTASNVTTIDFPLPHEGPSWPRVMFQNGSEVAAFLAPEPFLRAADLPRE